MTTKDLFTEQGSICTNTYQASGKGRRRLSKGLIPHPHQVGRFSWRLPSHLSHTAVCTAGQGEQLLTFKHNVWKINKLLTNEMKKYNDSKWIKSTLIQYGKNRYNIVK